MFWILIKHIYLVIKQGKYTFDWVWTLFGVLDLELSDPQKLFPLSHHGALSPTHAKYVILMPDHSPIAPHMIHYHAMTLLLCRLLQILWNSASNTIWVTSIKSRMNHPIMSVYKHYDQYSNTSILIYISLTKNHFNKRLSKLNS
jgi:hypothetical protein